MMPWIKEQRRRALFSSSSKGSGFTFTPSAAGSLSSTVLIDHLQFQPKVFLVQLLQPNGSQLLQPNGPSFMLLVL